MAIPLATLADVQARGHSFATVEAEQKMVHLLRLGSLLLRRRFTDLDVRIGQGDPDAETVVDVLVAMVLRAPSVVNPGGIRSESVSDDTYSVTYVATAGSGSDQIGLTAMEAALLAAVDLAPTPVVASARLRPMLS